MTLVLGLDYGQTECRLAQCTGTSAIPLYAATQPVQVWYNFQGKARLPKPGEVMGAGITRVLVDLKSSLAPPAETNTKRHDGLTFAFAVQIMAAVRAAARAAMPKDSVPALTVCVVPASALEVQRFALHAAAQKAGYPEVRLISETLAEAILLHRTRGSDGRYLVYHWGAGAFEASVIAISDQRYRVLSVCSDRDLTGAHLDRLLGAHLLDRLRRDNVAVPDSQTVDPLQWTSLLHHEQARLLYYCERAKIALSRGYELPVSVPAQTGKRKLKDSVILLTRAEFENLIRADVETTIGLAWQALAEARVTPDELDGVLTVGGTASMPLVQARCAEAFRQTPQLSDSYGAAKGAALYAQMLLGEQ